MSKICTKCGIEKSLDEFYKRNNGKYFRSSCKSCEIKYASNWNQTNPDRFKENRKSIYNKNRELEKVSNRIWKEKNKERANQLSRDWYWNNRELSLNRGVTYRENNRDLLREKTRQWFKENKNKACEYARKYQTLKRGRTVEAVCYEKVLIRDCGICHICGKPVMGEIHFDHIIPISRGGEHSMDNVAVSHALCNLKKSDKLLSELRFHTG